MITDKKEIKKYLLKMDVEAIKKLAGEFGTPSLEGKNKEEIIELMLSSGCKGCSFKNHRL